MLMLDNDQCIVLLQVILNHSITGYALVGEDGRFRYANPTFCRMLEYSEVELRGKRFQDVTDPEDVQADEEMAKLVAAGEYETYDMVKSYVTKTKKCQRVLLRVTGLKTNGKFICFVSEVAPINDAQARVVPPKVQRKLFIRTVKDYWVQIVFGVGLIASVAERIIDYRR